MTVVSGKKRDVRASVRLVAVCCALFCNIPRLSVRTYTYSADLDVPIRLQLLAMRMHGT